MGTPSAGDQFCAMQSNCGGCCAQAYATGFNTYLTQLMNCACGALCGAVCAQADDSFCADGQLAPDACAVCLNQSLGSGGGCHSQVISGCCPDSQCNAFTTCLSTCP